MEELAEVNYVLEIAIHQDESTCMAGLSDKSYSAKEHERFAMQGVLPQMHYCTRKKNQHTTMS